MLATVDSCLLAGLEGRLVEVQADAGNGKPEFHLVGLAATSVREARQRVRSAIKNSDLPFPLARLTVNLAPPEMRKEGSSLDLAIAVSIVLAHDGRKPPPRTAYLGELALDGGVRHVDGVLVAVRWLRDQHAVDMPDASVEGELAEVSGARRRLAAVVCQHNRDCDRQIQRAAFLPHLGRRQVDGEPRERKGQVAVLDRRPHALSRLPHGGGGETDQMKFRLAVAGVGLDLDQSAFEPGEEA